MSDAQQVQNRYHTSRVIHLAVVAALGGFLFGFDTAVINGAVNAISDNSTSARSSRVRRGVALLGCRSARGSPGGSPTATAASG